jgi:CubicO group peptidase (beta-lactamase class C family)
MLPATGLGQDQAEFESVRVLVRRLIAERNIPSVAIAAARDGRIVWEEGFGWADQERRVRADPTTMYSLASISKPITGTGLMVLVERGRVDLDRPVGDYLGAGTITAYEGDAAGATVRRIANHTAGLPLHYPFFYDGDAYRRPSLEQAISRYGILVTPPGLAFTYSNLGFGILERVIERVSGLPYDEYMRREVFAPLGLTRMAVFTRAPSGDSVAVRYAAAGRRLPWYDFDHRGASAVYSSARDLARFGMFHLVRTGQDRNRLLTDASLDELHRPTARRFPTVRYGVGWASYEEDDGVRSLGHGGGMPGVATSLRIYPEANAVVVVLLIAAGNAAASDIADAVARRLIPGLPERPRTAPEPPAPGFQPPFDLLGTWTGTLRTWQGELPLRVAVEPGAMRIGLDRAPVAVVAGPRWEDDRLTGRFAGTIPTPDASRTPGEIRFELRLIEGHLSGAMSVLAPDAYALSSYARLERAP